MADKYVAVVGNKRETIEATDSSTGVSEAGDIVALGTDGKINPNMLPPGAGPDLKNLEAFEALSAGDYVNIFDDGGTPKMRLADNSNGRPAHGFVLNSVSAAASENMYFEGANSALTGLTIGARYFLDTAGGVTATAPTGSGELWQYLGIACSATEINTDIEDCITLA